MATESDMAAYANNGRDWDQLCQALVWNWCDQFGSAPVTYASALDAYYASPIESGDAYSAPPGAHVYYDIGAYGHVSTTVDDGQGMASSHVVEFWGINAGRAASVAAYVGATGATPLGWSWSNGANSFPYEGGGGSGGGGGTDYAWGLSTDAQLALQQEMGRMPDPASGEPYYGGPADGAFGENSVAAMQRQLVVLGYLPADYAIDGVPGLNYGTALQELSADHGIPPYTGPIDGEPGDNTSVSLVGWANAQTPTPDPDPPDPDPPALPAVPAGTFFAVDVATSQAGFDFAAFKAAGGTRVLIKMGGGNASDSPYVAPEYVAQLAAARAAGLLVGHYWFNGRENGLTPTTSAQYMAEHADVAEGDVLALDVEREDDTDTDAYTPDEVLEFVAALADAKPSTGDPLVVYASESVVTSQDWSEVAATGAGLWVASWGGNDGTIPAEDPDPGDWGSWDIWQYSSAVIVPGHPERVDANIVQGDVWDRFGWHADEDPGPDPDPGDPSTVEVVETLVSYLGEASGLAERYSDLFAALLAPAPTFDEVVQPDPAAPTPPPDGPPRHRRRRFGRGT